MNSEKEELLQEEAHVPKNMVKGVLLFVVSAVVICFVLPVCIAIGNLYLTILETRQSMMYCEERDTEIPAFPIYPDSRLIDTPESHDFSGFSRYSYLYMTEDSSEMVLDFYRDEVGFCDEERAWCRLGSADPFGVYEVELTVEEKDEETTILIYLRWDKCPPFPPFRQDIDW